MKKIYLSVCALVMVGAVNAQSVKKSTFKKDSKTILESFTKGNVVRNKTTFYTNDFGTATDWSIGNNAGNADNWVIGTAGPAGGFALDPIVSTSAANGFAMFDSDLLCSGNQSAWIGNAAPVDCSTKNSVVIEFESFYRKFNDEIFVQVSTDNATWTDFQIHSTYANNDASANPFLAFANISAVAANQATVYFRFLFLSDASNGGDGCGYAWMVDDVSMREALGNDLELGDAYTHDIFGDYDYSIVPEGQITPMIVGVIVANLGSTAAVSTALNVKINDGTTDVYNQATSFDLAIGVTDTVWVTTGFTPVTNKTYTVSFSVPADDNTANDASVPVSFKTDNVTYAQDFTTTGLYAFPATSADVSETSMGNIFGINVNQNITGASVKFEAGTTATECVVRVSRFDYDNATFNSIQAMEYVGEVNHTIAPATIGAGTFTTINFTTPIAAEAGWYYVLEVVKAAGTDRLFLGRSAAGDVDNSTVCYGPFGAASAVNHFSGWGWSPAVRMLMESTNSIVENSSVSAFNVYPNPATEKVAVEFTLKNATNVDVTISDLSGKTVYTSNLGNKTAGSHSVNVNTTSFSNGIYVVNFTTATGIVTEKLVIRK